MLVKGNEVFVVLEEFDIVGVWDNENDAVEQANDVNGNVFKAALNCPNSGVQEIVTELDEDFDGEEE